LGNVPYGIGGIGCKYINVNTGASAQYSIALASGNTNDHASYGLGRAAYESEWAVAATAGTFASSPFPSAVGDTIIRNNNSGGNVIVGVDGAGYLSVNSLGIQTTSISATSITATGISNLPTVNSRLQQMKSSAQTITIPTYSPTRITSCVSAITSGATSQVFTLLQLNLTGVRPQFTFSGTIALHTTDVTSNAVPGLANITFAATAAISGTANTPTAPNVVNSSIISNVVNSATGTVTYGLSWSGSLFQLTVTSNLNIYGVAIMSAECFAVENIGVLRGTITPPPFTVQTISTSAAY
jgi:hypothetical protein